MIQGCINGLSDASDGRLLSNLNSEVKVPRWGAFPY